jgi:hypothetical protein
MLVAVRKVWDVMHSKAGERFEMRMRAVKFRIDVFDERCRPKNISITYSR